MVQEIPVFSDFLKYLFPRVVLERNLRFSYTFCLGGLTFSSFLIMLVSGMLLLVYYQPTPERAFSSSSFSKPRSTAVNTCAACTA